MLVKVLIIFTACFTSCVISHRRFSKDEYENLVNLLYEKYKLYKRDHIPEDSSRNDYSSTYRTKARDKRVYDRNTLGNDISKRSNILSLHSVTPVHDDESTDDAAKRHFKDLHDGVSKFDFDRSKSDILASVQDSLPKMDLITPVHDDEEDATQKHIVPIHDDMDLTANHFLEGFKNMDNSQNSNANSFGKNDDNEVDDSDNYFGTDGTYHIKNMENDKEESILEVEGGSEDQSNSVLQHMKHGMEVHSIQMPHVAPQKMDTYLCYAHKLPEDRRYIVEYQPLAEKRIAHHMLLFGCDEPYSRTGVWPCREMTPVCKGRGQSIMYAWAKNAPPLKMPTNVGFEVGGDSGYKYLVLQVHYLNVDKFVKEGETDNSGIRFFLDKTDKRFLAGIYLLANGFTPIPPHMTKAHIDMGCYYPNGPKFFPFRFRVHAHKLGVVITGYRVRNNNWTIIGRGDPQRPQAFFNVFHDIDIQPGDTLMGRCTYNSTSRDTVTEIGATHSDEMCNFYIMYFYDTRFYKGGYGEFPCGPVNKETKGSLFNKFPEDSDIALATMEEANRLNFVKKGVLDMAYKPVHGWPVDGLKDGELPLTIGQVTGVDLTNDNKQVVILHRGDRVWGFNTFNRYNVLNKTYQDKAIEVNPIVWLDRKTGAIKKAKGAGLFYLPHGITIDTKGNIWITDVGSHQVYKLSPEMKVLMTLGHKFVPGHHGPSHFCKPTDVAVMGNGDFYVSDGYCNNRVVKFDINGKMLLQISADTNPNKGIFPSPQIMSVVHSLSLDDNHKCLFVADRENGRILMFNATTGRYHKQIKVDAGAVYAVEYNPREGGFLHFITGPLIDEPVDISGYTYSVLTDSIVSRWGPEKGFSLPHDLAVSDDNKDAFVAEINPYKIWKFSKVKNRP